MAGPPVPQAEPPRSCRLCWKTLDATNIRLMNSFASANIRQYFGDLCWPNIPGETSSRQVICQHCFSKLTKLRRLDDEIADPQLDVLQGFRDQIWSELSVAFHGQQNKQGSGKQKSPETNALSGAKLPYAFWRWNSRHKKLRKPMPQIAKTGQQGPGLALILQHSSKNPSTSDDVGTMGPVSVVPVTNISSSTPQQMQPQVTSLTTPTAVVPSGSVATVITDIFSQTVTQPTNQKIQSSPSTPSQMQPLTEASNRVDIGPTPKRLIEVHNQPSHIRPLVPHPPTASPLVRQFRAHPLTSDDVRTMGPVSVVPVTNISSSSTPQQMQPQVTSLTTPTAVVPSGSVDTVITDIFSQTVTQPTNQKIQSLPSTSSQMQPLTEASNRVDIGPSPKRLIEVHNQPSHIRPLLPHPPTAAEPLQINVFTGQSQPTIQACPPCSLPMEIKPLKAEIVDKDHPNNHCYPVLLVPHSTPLVPISNSGDSEPQDESRTSAWGGAMDGAECGTSSQPQDGLDIMKTLGEDDSGNADVVKDYGICNIKEEKDDVGWNSMPFSHIGNIKEEESCDIDDNLHENDACGCGDSMTGPGDHKQTELLEAISENREERPKASSALTTQGTCITGNQEGILHKERPSCDGLTKEVDDYSRLNKFICSTCGKCFALISSLHRHVTIHRNKQYACSVCGKPFWRLENLKSHVRIHSRKKLHTSLSEKDLSSTTVGKVFTDIASQSSHGPIHSSENAHTCSWCGAVFTRLALLQLHVRTHINKDRKHDLSIDGNNEEPATSTTYDVGFDKTKSQELEPSIEKSNACITYNDAGFDKADSQELEPGTEKSNACTTYDAGFGKAGSSKSGPSIEKSNACTTHDASFTKAGSQEPDTESIFDYPFSCTTCGNHFPNIPSLNAHVRTHGFGKPHVSVLDSKKTHTCSWCGSVFTRLALLQIHMRTHINKNRKRDFCSDGNNGKPATCTTYDAGFDNAESQELEPSTEKSNTCTTYDAGFGKAGSSESEGSIEKSNTCTTYDAGSQEPDTGSISDNPFSCTTCGNHFPNTTSLNAHVRTHGFGKPHVSVLQILRKVHKRKNPTRRKCNKIPDQRSNTCDACGKTFSRARYLRSHVKLHNGLEAKPHACKECGKRFSRESHLKTHIWKHTGEKLYVCSICGLSIATLRSLRRHESRHTLGNLKHPCKICGQELSDAQGLRRHVRTHTGEKPYMCMYCGKSYNLSSNLLVHERIHSGVKPHKCTVCGKRFVSSGSLKKHVGTHSSGHT